MLGFTESEKIKKRALLIGGEGLFILDLVTLRSHGYGDVAATNICRAEIPSHIYANHQYRQKSECESTVVVYIPTIIV